LTGHLADLENLRFALLVPALCYAVILLFGIYARLPAAGAYDSVAPAQPRQ
jgi:MFS transporter, FHS family, L-fucose permease